jgi:hypothetical protein
LLRSNRGESMTFTYKTVISFRHDRKVWEARCTAVSDVLDPGKGVPLVQLCEKVERKTREEAAEMAPKLLGTLRTKAMEYK